MGKIDKYVICKEEKITVETLAEYTHSQNLSVDPTTLIKYLSNGDNILTFPKNITLEVNPITSINKLRKLHERIHARVQNFGE